MKKMLMAGSFILTLVATSVLSQVRHSEEAPPDLEERIQNEKIPKEYLDLPRVPYTKDELTPELIDKYKKLHKKGITHFEHNVTDFGQYLWIGSAKLEEKVSKAAAKGKDDKIIKTALKEIESIIGDIDDLDLRVGEFSQGETGYSVQFDQFYGDVKLGSGGGVLSINESADVVTGIQAMLVNTDQPNLDPSNWLPMSTVRTIAYSALQNATGVKVPAFHECDTQYGKLGNKEVLMSRDCGNDYAEELSVFIEDTAQATPKYVIRHEQTTAVVNAVTGTFEVGSTRKHAYTDFTTTVCADLSTGATIQGCPTQTSTTSPVFVENSSGDRVCVQPPNRDHCGQDRFKRLFDEIKYIEGWLSSVSSSDCCIGIGNVNVRGNSDFSEYVPSQTTIHIDTTDMAVTNNVMFRDIISHEWGHAYIHKKTVIDSSVTSTHLQNAYEEAFGDITAQMNQANRGTQPDWIMFEGQPGSRTIGSQTWNNFSTSNTPHTNSKVISAFYKRVYNNLSGPHASKADTLMKAMMNISRLMNDSRSGQASTKSDLTGINEFDFKRTVEIFLQNNPSLIEVFYKAWEDTNFPGEIQAAPANVPQNFTTSFAACVGSQGSNTLYRGDWNSVVNADQYNLWALDPAIGVWILETYTTNTFGYLITTDVLNYIEYAAVSAANSVGDSGLSNSRAVISICYGGSPA